MESGRKRSNDSSDSKRVKRQRLWRGAFNRHDFRSAGPRVEEPVVAPTISIMLQTMAGDTVGQLGGIDPAQPMSSWLEQAMTAIREFRANREIPGAPLSL